MERGTENNEKTKTGEKLTSYEVYHIWMQVYPAYTIERIENELSWRMIREMMKCWDHKKTSFFVNQRIEQILMKANNMIEVSTAGKSMGDTQLLSKFSQLGLL